ncbi:MAG: porin [Pseudomonadota bacterium]
MQKKIIALAVAAAAAAPAFAQSNVQIYGIMDVYFARSSGNSLSASGVGSGGLNASRIGVKVSDDLGNGMKAYANIESAITAGQDTTNASAFGGTTRQSYVGLSGSFGAVQMGTQSSLSDAWSGAYDYAADLSAKTFLRGAGSTGIAKVANSVAYLSPSFSGATVGLAHVASELAAAKTDINQIGVNYGNGPIKATYVYSKTASNGAKGSFLGLGYDFKVVNVMFEYTDTKTAGVKDKFWQLGAVIPVSAVGNIHVGTGKETEADGTSGKSTIVAYTHGLSKRTTAYAGVVRNSSEAAYTGAAPGGLFASVPGVAGQGYTNIAVGMRHTF